MIVTLRKMWDSCVVYYKLCQLPDVLSSSLDAKREQVLEPENLAQLSTAHTEREHRDASDGCMQQNVLQHSKWGDVGRQHYLQVSQGHDQVIQEVTLRPSCSRLRATAFAPKQTSLNPGVCRNSEGSALK
eukprot:TRINITY_DN14586_c0_g1_i2.p1 TRINITY_DN14586_c0_g1~~TRINITY_DN14586_c0_g1_i2.p1  ORF type:complete len:130 (+),score=15.83 TRINITY_DN14586_c0_g1_i2:317-706(+)